MLKYVNGNMYGLIRYEDTFNLGTLEQKMPLKKVAINRICVSTNSFRAWLRSANINPQVKLVIWNKKKLPKKTRLSTS